MVLKLRELLIKEVALHLPALSPDHCQRLTADQRERILRWLAAHDRLSHHLIPCVTQSLLTTPLSVLEFYKCQQLTNKMLIEFAQACRSSRLKSLIIHKCDLIEG